ncbi:hypothetical protein ZWY2020_045858 [Hordeum vulgare]|nr:hypothetical protein ZWY2020_045858 [Hordeum vulgare]
MLPRLPASLHLQSLRWASGFSSSSAPAAAAKEGADGKIVAAVVFERLPVVIPKIHPVVYAFQEFSFRWRLTVSGYLNPPPTASRPLPCSAPCRLIAHRRIPPSIRASLCPSLHPPCPSAQSADQSCPVAAVDPVLSHDQTQHTCEPPRFKFLASQQAGPHPATSPSRLRPSNRFANPCFSGDAAAGILAMRHPRKLVLAGCLSALTVMTALSASLGWVAPNLISRKWRYALLEMYAKCGSIQRAWQGTPSYAQFMYGDADSKLAPSVKGVAATAHTACYYVTF